MFYGTKINDNKIFQEWIYNTKLYINFFTIHIKHG